MEFLLHLSNAETETTTWGIADTDHVVNQWEREIFDITSNEQMQFKKEFSIYLIECEAWWHATGI